VTRRRPDERSIAFVKKFKAMTSDPHFQLKRWLAGLESSGNPSYAWKAIHVCLEHQIEFPDWVRAYLHDCSDRMFSQECADRMKAPKGSDLRKVLPWILGFPNVLEPDQRKRGPGNLLNPDSEDGKRKDKMSFALKFAIRLENGDDPQKAMVNASAEIFSEGAEEKTLWNWLLKEFDLKKRPATADEWKTAARRALSVYKIVQDLTEDFSRDSDVQ
jgi:hypothetical protein